MGTSPFRLLVGTVHVDKCPLESDIIQSGKRKTRLCPTFAFSGECLLDCPHNYIGDNPKKTCVPCSNTSNCENVQI